MLGVLGWFSCRWWTDYLINIYGGFHKWRYPQIIHFSRIFPNKPTIFGYPHLWKPPYRIQSISCLSSGFSALLIWLSESLSRNRVYPEIAIETAKMCLKPLDLGDFPMIHSTSSRAALFAAPWRGKSGHAAHSTSPAFVCQDPHRLGMIQLFNPCWTWIFYDFDCTDCNYYNNMNCIELLLFVVAIVFRKTMRCCLLLVVMVSLMIK